MLLLDMINSTKLPQAASRGLAIDNGAVVHIQTLYIRIGAFAINRALASVDGSSPSFGCLCHIFTG